ncbi:MAG: histidinol-phosphatase [Oligosphaeraceae bacterium]|nr:histidinol-phosphatase [Oligosphaeraceae bacterium]
MLRANFHTHTYLCKHAGGNVAEYCQAALDSGVSILGFTDHCPHPDSRWSAVRMDMSELPGYIADIEKAKIDFPQLHILNGMECEYVPEFGDYQRDYFLDELGLDYLLGACHSYLYKGEYHGVHGQTMDADQLAAYAAYMCACMRSGIYAAMAHPDLFGMAIWRWDAAAESCSRRILQCAQECCVPLELNAYGLRKPLQTYAEGERHMYPVAQFWELAAEYDIEVLVGSDAHQPEDVWGNNDDCYEIAQKHGLKVINDVFVQRVLEAKEARHRLI